MAIEGNLTYLAERSRVAATREAQLKQAIEDRDRFREALKKIAYVQGEDDPAILWPWARDIAADVLR